MARKKAQAAGSADGGEDRPLSFYFINEIMYHCIRAHEEAVRKRKLSRPGYDPSWAEKSIGSARAMLEETLVHAGLVGPRRDDIIAAWDRRLEPDVIEEVRASFVQRLVSAGLAHDVLKFLLQMFFIDREYQADGNLRFYGGASLCLHFAQSAGIDPEQLTGELADEGLGRAPTGPSGHRD